MRATGVGGCFEYHRVLATGASGVMKQIVQPVLAVCIIVACGVSMASEPTVPEHTAAPCAILLGGGGTTVFASEKLHHLWFEVNRSVSSAAAEALQGMGYRIDPLIVDSRDIQQRKQLLENEIDREHCNRIIEITYKLTGQSVTMPGVAADFGFDVEVMGIGSDHVLIGLYQKAYSYPLTSQVMQSLSLSGVGKSIAADIVKAQVIGTVAPSSGSVGSVR